ncbi:interferon-induced protein 44-like isoform X2 [Pristis pectinata]|uniref:interferon-induced protein 44-like isoform X2 n=1 Tax=Pristis pectinata TaxID=685728 RepID=UPI00223C8CBA|nr:interferon-induced protein 44-like isoform X2 [Pristis pectinata]
MSVITSRLTEEDLKLVFETLGKVKLHFLYKASIHGFHTRYFFEKCTKQGPTLTVGYMGSNCIFGSYISRDLSNYENRIDNRAFLFRIANTGAERVITKFDVKLEASAFSCYSKTGLNFGDSLVFMADEKANVNIRPGQSYNLDDTDPFDCNVPIDLIELETYRVEELKTPLRKIDWSPRKRTELMDFVKTHKPFQNSATRPTILLIGPLGAGKSSFINSTDAIFREFITNRALAGNVTTKFSKYSFQAGRISPSLVLCDTMGLAEDREYGISSEDIVNIINGLIPNQYQFNTALPVGVDQNSSTDSTVHCVAYVVDASQNPILSSRMVKKMLGIQSQLNLLGIPQIVLLTKVDKACFLVADDLEYVYRSEHITRKIIEVGEQLKIPITCVAPIKNYWLSHELDCSTDILILSALVLMLHSVDTYFENKANLFLE